jgi:hypothetical protein
LSICRLTRASSRPPAAQQREPQALTSQLPDDTHAAGADRLAGGDFFLPRDGASQEQVGDIRAGDHQHEHYCCEEQQQCGTNRPYDLLMQQNHGDIDIRIGLRIRHGETARDSIHLRLRLRHGNTGPEARKQPQGTASAVSHAISKHQRSPHLSLRLPEGRELELRRHHSDDGITPIR